jgi:hypothetical protein
MYALTILSFNSTHTNDMVENIHLDVRKLLQQVQTNEGTSKKYGGSMKRFLEDTETVIMSEPDETAIPPSDFIGFDDDEETVVTLCPEDAIDERLERLNLGAQPMPLTHAQSTEPSLSVTTLSRETDHINHFCTGSDGHVYEAHWQPEFGGRYHCWWQRGSVTVPTNGYISAVSHAVGHMYLFTTDVDGRVVGCSASPSNNAEGEIWTDWEQIADGFAPPGAYVGAVVWKKGGNPQIELFVCRADRKIWTIGYGWSSVTQQNGWLGSWSKLSPDSIEAVPGCVISAVARLDDHLDVYLTDVEGKVMTTAQGATTGGWLHWWDWGIVGVPGGVVTAVVQYTNRLDIFLVNPRGVVINSWWDGAKQKPGWNWWNGPFEILSNTKFPPGGWITSLSRSERHIDLFGVAQDGKVVAAANNRGENWGGWWHINDGHGHPGRLVAGCVRQKDYLDLVCMRKADKQIQNAAWTPQNTNWFAGWWTLKDIKPEYS